MADGSSNEELVRRSVAGDQVALRLLLTLSHAALVTRIRQRLPARLRTLVDPEDVAQDAYMDVFRRIAQLELRTSDAFERWLGAIALNRLRTAIRQQHAQRRGGGWVRVQAAGPPSDSATTLLALLEGTQSTPSRAVARGEDLAALESALEALPPRYRQAIQLVHLDERPVRDAAGALGCSERAVHGLCRRGMTLLRRHLSRSGRTPTR